MSKKRITNKTTADYCNLFPKGPMSKKDVGTWKKNQEELWESIELIYDFVAELKPSILPDKNTLSPEPKIYAQKIIEALAKITEGEEGHR